jgi:ABC-type branched-subunit amino acid transport system ATPase component
MSPGKINSIKNMPLLEVKNLSKRFGGLQAVKDVSFSVNKGCIKALIGPNGAGKTTLFNCVAFFRPTRARFSTGICRSTQGTLMRSRRTACRARLSISGFSRT